MEIYIGSARHDENGKYVGGKAGDQKQTSSTFDTKGEVSIQSLASFIGSKKWYIVRAKTVANAKALASAMKTACNNANVGYNQNSRLEIVTYGVDAKYPVNSDCSSLVRACVIKATGKDPGNFITSNEPAILKNTGLFDAAVIYTSASIIYEGDILVTQGKGHTGICVEGNARDVSSLFYPRYLGSTSSIVTALQGVGEKDVTLAHRQKIALANGITNYKGTAAQNLKLLSLVKNGILVKA